MKLTNNKMCKNQFLGWRSLVGCFLCMFIVQGSIQTFAIFMPQVAADTGWKLTQVAMVSTVSTVSAFCSNLLISKVLKKLGAKRLMMIGAALLAVHFTLFSIYNNVYLFCLEGLIGGIIIAWGTVAPCTIIVNNWFIKNRSQYVAVIVAAAMFGSVLFNPLSALLIENIGWRGAYRVLAAFVGVVGVLSVRLLVSESPASKGQLPYGFDEVSDCKNTNTVNDGIELADAKKSSAYWLLAVGIFFIGLSTNIENYMPAFWQSQGLHSVTSSAIMSAYAFIAAVGSIFMSKVNDKLGGKKFVMITSLLFAVSVFVMTYTKAVENLIFLIICCIPFAIGGKKASSLTAPLVVAETFGRKDYASIIGTFTAMLQLGIGMSNIVIGKLLPNGYPVTFTTMIVINLVGMLCLWLAVSKKPYRP